MKPPRKVPNKDDFYMGLVFMMASRSKDPNTAVGAAIVDGENNVPLGWGYNGAPRCIDDNFLDWSRPAKYDYMIHAEENAILHARCDLSGAIMYITVPPCNPCMTKIAAVGIAKVVYFPKRSIKDKNSSLNSGVSDRIEEIAKKGGIQLVEYSGNLNWMRDRIDDLHNAGIFST